MAADLAPETADAADEELVLGAEAIVSTPPKTFSDDAYGAPPVRPAEPARRWLAPGNETDSAPAQPTPRVKLGGTLFERMSNAARGAQRDEAADGAEAVDIPRFLHKQGNQ
jgi:cell division protein FtsZ